MLREVILKAGKGEFLSEILNNHGYKALPANVILNKRLPGLGATYCEITSPRNSIIIEPNVPVIQSKSEKHPHVLRVYAGVKDKEINDYFERQTDCRKIITTPESFGRIKKVFDELNIDIYTDYFLLFDECEKLVQDIDYRETIEDPMDDFFKFQNKAMVSATPVNTNDPRLKAQGFTNLVIEPIYEYKKELTLITTNNIAETLSETIFPLRGKVCIFTNSIDTIDSLYRDIPELKKSITFCSPDGMQKLYDWKNRKKETFIGELAQYNFFTARFFSAVDIECKTKPHVIFISDLFGAPHSVIDPDTEAVQIVGRFRNGVKSITHITSINPGLECMTRKEAKEYIEGADMQYNQWKRDKEQSRNEGQRTMLQEAIQSCSYARSLTPQGEQNPFRIANFHEDQRVNRLYTSGELLMNAYRRNSFFELTYRHENHIFNDNDRLALHRVVTKKGRARLLLMRLEKIEHLRLSGNGNQREKYGKILAKLITGPSEKALHDCFLKYGAEFVRGTDFKEQVILNSLQRKRESIIQNSKIFEKAVHQKIKVGEKYARKELQTLYGSICEANGMPIYKSTPIKDIERFFDMKERRINGLRVYEIVNIKDNKGKNKKSLTRNE